jgi:prolyl-tRNA editing enzyme YbaK/EbsC (Cys-tRNA(Pro) deacylase)
MGFIAMNLSTAPDSSSLERVRAAILAAGLADTITAFPAGTRTAADAAAAIGCTVAQIAKSIVLRAGARPVVVIASGANRVDTAKVAARLGMAVKRADADWVRETTGFAVGGVAPLGHLAPPILLFDADLMTLDPVWAAAGTPSHVFSVAPDALLRATGVALADIRQD